MKISLNQFKNITLIEIMIAMACMAIMAIVTLGNFFPSEHRRRSLELHRLEDELKIEKLKAELLQMRGSNEH